MEEKESQIPIRCSQIYLELSSFLFSVYLFKTRTPLLSHLSISFQSQKRLSTPLRISSSLYPLLIPVILSMRWHTIPQWHDSLSTTSLCSNFVHLFLFLVPSNHRASFGNLRRISSNLNRFESVEKPSESERDK